MKKLEDIEGLIEIGAYTLIKDGNFFGKVISYFFSKSCIVEIFINGVDSDGVGTCERSSGVAVREYPFGDNYTNFYYRDMAMSCENPALSNACSSLRGSKIFTESELAKIYNDGLRAFCEIMGTDCYSVI